MFDDMIRIAIESPTAIAAFTLEDRLRHLQPSAVARGDAWCVELDADALKLDEIRAVIRQWLHDIGVASAVMRYAGERHTVTSNEAPPLGAGYDDGPALEHEP